MPNRDLVAIGGSAGSVEVLRAFTSDLPDQFAAAVLIVIHMRERSILPEVLSYGSALPVAFAEDGARIERGRIYVAPPDLHTTVLDGRLAVRRGPRENNARPAIDPLFRSVAGTFGARAIGVVLSGALDDGTAGLVQIKRHGGTSVVQDPADAATPSMPQSALEAMRVDHVVTARGLAPLIRRLVAEPAPPAAAGGPGPSAAGASVLTEGGTAPASAPGQATVFSCPDCGGRLSTIDDAGLIRFRCTVGHRHSPQSLFAAQSDDIERALWVALRTNEERAALLRRLGRDAERAGRHSAARGWDERAAEYESHVRTIRQLLDSALPAALPGEVEPAS